MHTSGFTAAVAVVTGLCGSVSAQALNKQLLITSPSISCKVIPTDSNWPSTSSWNALNSTVGGRLIAPMPAGKVCYPGSLNTGACNAAIANSANETLVTADPLGLFSPPFDYTCPPLPPAVANSKFCTLDSFPRFIVKATSAADVQAAVNFAASKNVRLVVHHTGHSLSLGSTGPNSLQVWTRNIRTGITFQASYKSASCCTASGWTGAAISYSAGYQWFDVYAVAQANNVIVVGGGDPTVSAAGGYIQGGGHGPASQKFGLAASQVLEFQVVTANGQLVIANDHVNTDLYWALRGGGGGSFGVVTQVTIKAYPNQALTAQVLQIMPLTTSSADQAAFVQALEILYANYAALTDAGISGAAQWKVKAAAPFVTGSTSLTGYQGSWMMFGSQAAFEAAFASVNTALQALSSHLEIVVLYMPFPDYWSFYNKLAVSSTTPAPVGYGAALASHLFDRKGLSNATNVANMLKTLIGAAGDFCEIDLEIIGGGATAQTSSALAVSPGWSTMIVHSIISRPFGPSATAAQVDALRVDMTYHRNAAQKAVSPNTGAYLNEADTDDPDFQTTYWGANLPRLLSIKAKYDPKGVFYCNVCVGSTTSAVDGLGRLCTLNNAAA